MGCYSRWRLNRVAAGSPEPAGFREHLGACEICRGGLDVALAVRWASLQAMPRRDLPSVHLDPKQMLGLLEDAVSERRQQQVIAHLAGCEPCRAQFADFVRAAQDLDSGAAVR